MGQERQHPVDVFAPGASDYQKGLRKRIHQAGDAADARRGRSHLDEAIARYWWISNLARRWVFAPATDQQLNDVLAILARDWLNVQAIERLEPPHAG